MDALREWRRETARQQRIPAYRVLTDRQLGEVAVASPRSEEALLAVPGMGPKKLERFGAGILRVLREVAP